MSEVSDPYHLSKNDYNVMEHIRGDIQLKVDKNRCDNHQYHSSGSLICKILADSVREHLQQFIIQYRTNKARKDLEYYQKLTTGC